MADDDESGLAGSPFDWDPRDSRRERTALVGRGDRGIPRSGKLRSLGALLRQPRIVPDAAAAAADTGAAAADDFAGAPREPIIKLGSAVVVVKKPYTNPARKAVELKTNAPFDGSGELTRSNDAIRFFTAAVGGVEIRFDGKDNVFSGGKLTGGVTLFAEGAKASAALADVKLTLALSGGSQPVKPPATSTMTAVELTLDICMSRSKPGADPAPLSTKEKIDTGRFLQVQDAGNNAGRAMLVVQKAKPAAFTGSLVLAPMDARVRIFAAEDPKAGAALPTPHVLANGAIPKNGAKLWAQAAAVSGALRDTGLRVGVKDVEPEGDLVKITAVSFTEIKTTIKPTPANTARAGIAAPLNHEYKSTSISEDFVTNTPLVLMRNAQPDIRLEVACAPAGLPVLWQAIRNPKDHAKLGAVGSVPTVAQDAVDVKKANLDANEKGSFRIRAFIDCNGTNSYQDKEPSIPLNLVLADATVVTDNSVANPGTLSATIAGGGVSIRNGAWPAGAGALTAAHLAAAGMAMELVADVTGGGADGRLGLDRVFSGLVNDLTNVDIRAEYRDTTVAPPTNHNLINLYVSNTAAATAAMGTTPAFQLGDPAPAPYAWPLLDTGRAGAGTGGETATMTRRGPHTAVNRPVGQRWTMRCIDSPGRGFPTTHIVNGSAGLRTIHYLQQFAANFCFWTNVSVSRAATGHPADRLYSVLQIVAWEIVGDWNVDFAAAPPTLTATTAHNVRVTGRTTVTPIDRAQDHGVEVRPPSGIGAAIAWDAR